MKTPSLAIALLALVLFGGAVADCAAADSAQNVIKCKNAVNGDEAYFYGLTCPAGWYPIW